MKSAIFPKIVKRLSLIVMVTLSGLVAAVLLMASAGPTLALADPPEPAFGTRAVGNVIGSGAVGVDSQDVTGAPPAALAAGRQTTITLELNPTRMIANSNQTSIITATVTDLNGHPVQGRQVTGSLPSPSFGTISAFPATNSSGQATGTWTAAPGSVAGSGTLTVTDGTSTATAAITLTAETPTTIVLTAVPTSLQVGSYSRLRAQVRNQFGYLVSDGTSVTFHTNRGYFTFDTDATQNGLALTDTGSRDAGVATITATSGLAVSNQVAVTFTPGNPAELTLTASPPSQVVGANSVLTAIISDSFGNRVGSGITVTFATDRDTVSPNPATTTSNGIATSTISSTLVGTAHVTATAGTATGSTSVTFTPGTGYTVTLKVPTTAQVVGTTSVLTATVTDQFGNPVADGTFVTITKDSGVFVNSPLQTTSGGAHTVFSSTIAATRRITAESGLDRDTKSVTFVPDVPFSLTLIARPVSQTVGLSSILTATVADRFNNRVTSGRSVTFTKDLAGTIWPQVSTTNANGIATSRVTITVASLAHITATGETPTTWNATVITFTPSTPVTPTVQLSNYNLIAGSSATSTITATIRDVYGNPIQGITTLTSTLPLTLGQVSGFTPTNQDGQASGMWTATPGTTPGGGWLSVGIRVGSQVYIGRAPVSLGMSDPATVTVRVISSTLFANSGMTSTVVAEVRDTFNNLRPNSAVNFSLSSSALGTVVAASPFTDENGQAYAIWTAGSTITHGQVIANSGTPSGSTAITLTADDPFTVTVQANPPSPAAGVGSTLTATVVDRFQNPVADNTRVTLASDLGTVSPTEATTINGVALSHINWTLVGTVHVTATSRSRQGTAAVVFVPNAPCTMTLTAQPVLLTVGSRSALTATVYDCFTNLVANNTSVTFTTNLTGSIVSPVKTTYGIATSEISTTKSGTATVTATSGAARNTVAVTFKPDVPTRTSAQSNPNTLPVCSSVPAIVTVTAFDRHDNPVPGVILTGSILPSILGRLTLTGTTNAAGQVIGHWTAGTVLGTGAIVVSSTGAIYVSGASVTITVVPLKVFVPVLLKDYPPVPSNGSVSINSGAANTYQVTATLQVSATMQGDYVESMRFSNNGSSWSNWMAFAPIATWTLDSNNGLKTVYAQFKAHLGGISSIVSDNIFLFKNGDFTQPNQANWNLDPGNVLSVTGANEPGSPTNPAGLLGSPAYACTNVPIGYGGINQNLIMPNVPAGQRLVLRFNYHIYTFDTNPNLKDTLDRFDVFLNNNRVFRDMYNSKQNDYGCTTLHDLGRKDKAITIDPAQYKPGSTIIVDFRLYNLPDSLYNTYVYLDNVRLEFQPNANNLNEMQLVPEMPGGHIGR